MMKIDRKLKQTTCLTTIKKVQVQKDNVSEMFGGCCQHLRESLQAPRDQHKEQIVQELQELQELHSDQHCMAPVLADCTDPVICNQQTSWSVFPGWC